MKYHVIYTDCEGFHCEYFDDINDANSRLTEVYSSFLNKENDTTEPIVIYGIVAKYDKRVSVECAVMGD